MQRAETDAIQRSPLAKVSLLSLFCLMTLVFIGLGVWQLQRLNWKQDLIARVEERIHAEPQVAPGPAEWAAINSENSEYRRVSLTGHYLLKPATLTMAVTDLGSGFWVMAPFQTSDGFTVLVNRGFVPESERSSQMARAAPEEERQVVGLLRISEPGGGFLRSNDPAADRWYSRDVAAIAKARGLGEVAAYFVDADRQSESGQWPRGGMTIVQFRNSHLVYAITWLCLAIMSAAAFGASLWMSRSTAGDRV